MKRTTKGALGLACIAIVISIGLRGEAADRSKKEENGVEQAVQQRTKIPGKTDSIKSPNVESLQLAERIQLAEYLSVISGEDLVAPCEQYGTPDRNLGDVDHGEATLICGPVHTNDPGPSDWYVSEISPENFGRGGQVLTLIGASMPPLAIYLDGTRLEYASAPMPTRIELLLPMEELSGPLNYAILDQNGVATELGELLPYYENRVGAFDFFKSNDDGTSPVNSYLLSYLSMVVYSQEVQPDDFREELLDKLLPMGAEDVEVFVDQETGAEAALVILKDAVIVAFRGTSSEGTEGENTDYITDGSIYTYQASIDGTQVQIHAGFWRAVDSVYSQILQRVEEEYLQGKSVWFTGHSLGAADATVAAFRMHYDDRIEVQGLQTFGSPRVGDIEFFDKANEAGPGGVSLASVTRRWVIQGDPAPTFFTKGIAFRRVRTWLGFYIWVSYGVEYEHVGITNTVFRDWTGDGYTYTVFYDTGELPMAIDLLELADALTDEHMDYQNATQAEMDRMLVEAGEGSQLNEILE